MEEDEFSDHESVKVRIIEDIKSQCCIMFYGIDNQFCCFRLQGQIDDHGVFKTLAKLWQHNAHLAVFMNFVMSNCDPASLVKLHFLHFPMNCFLKMYRNSILMVGTVLPFDNGSLQRGHCQGYEEVGL